MIQAFSKNRAPADVPPTIRDAVLATVDEGSTSTWLGSTSVQVLDGLVSYTVTGRGFKLQGLTGRDEGHSIEITCKRSVLSGNIVDAKVSIPEAALQFRGPEAQGLAELITKALKTRATDAAVESISRKQPPIDLGAESIARRIAS